MQNKRIQFISLSILFAIIGLVTLLIWLPYLKIVALGAILAILFSPVQKAILRHNNKKTIAAFFTVLLILLIVFIPLYFIGQALFNEMLGLYHNFKAGDLASSSSEVISRLPQGVQNTIHTITQDIGQKISGLSASVVSSITNVISNLAGFAASFFLILFTVFYLLRDSDRIRSYVASILPLSQEHENLLISKIESAVSGVVKGSFLVALIQGSIATIGFFIFGVPNALLWGAFTVFAALVPTIGTSLSLIPAVLYLFIIGHTGMGIGLLIWAVLAVGMIDNIVGPKLVGSTTDLHPLLVLFSILGGISFFGFIGFLLGPIIMAIFVAMVDIYRTDLGQFIEKQNS
jgi:predicted PurR-regulated permease PerM